MIKSKAEPQTGNSGRANFSHETFNIQLERLTFGQKPIFAAMSIYDDILTSKAAGRKLLAILLDPDKIEWQRLDILIAKISASPATHIFIGGSIVQSGRIDELIVNLSKEISIPIVLFPGHPSQISYKAHGILFLSLLSGRNPDFLIGHHVKSAPELIASALEIIPTGYILIDGGSVTSVEKASGTKPLSDHREILATAQAGELLGKKLIYLEAGSGAKTAVSTIVISNIAAGISIPLIVGGGIRSAQEVQNAYEAGADLVVIGTAFEKDLDFFEKHIIAKSV